MEWLILRNHVTLVMPGLFSLVSVSRKMLITMKNENARLCAGLYDRLKGRRLALVQYVHLSPQ